MKGWEECEVFAFLTTEEERDAWLRADWSEATVLQRPLADGTLEIVKRGLKHDIG
jgi:putative SOS response-associated peptidase YedK